jgi:thioredoxin-related protein
MRYLLPLILAASMVVLSCNTKDDQDTTKVDTLNQKTEKLKWYSYNDGVKKAVKENKNILLDFYADWCRYCKIMEKETFSDPEVLKELNKNYVAIRIHTDKKTGEKINFKKHSFTTEQFASGLGVQGLPTVVFMNSNQDIISKVPGYIKKDRFLPMLMYINNECYAQKIKFPDFLENQSICKKKKS